MTEPPRDFEGEDEQTRDLAPENDNSEQDDEGAQAHTFVSDARTRDAEDVLGPQGSEKVHGGIADEDDTQDLVDHMNQMVTSGRIDMSAFRGEPAMDDEDEAYGSASDDDDLDELTEEEE